MTNVTQQYWADTESQHFMDFGKKLGNAWLAVVRWRQRNRAIRELSALSDWQLQDIGLTRGTISEAVDSMLSPRSSSATIVELPNRTKNEVTDEHLETQAA
ncbi:MAG: DUF1127 domain-containing protein [Gammaproteobacteria bacterium]|nr:DUF1127 domain-containing protein [Gammaproteobacteria bacterium]MDH3466556.1 DUF1127 domain-containing protein [Gammaproteobacteria bacterium]